MCAAQAVRFDQTFADERQVQGWSVVFLLQKWYGAARAFAARAGKRPEATRVARAGTGATTAACAAAR